jgi:hypothetical protein
MLAFLLTKRSLLPIPVVCVIVVLPGLSLILPLLPLVAIVRGRRTCGWE